MSRHGMLKLYSNFVKLVLCGSHEVPSTTSTSYSSSCRILLYLSFIHGRPTLYTLTEDPLFTG